ncbi:MAG: CPBP family intramembrane metalloprotease [Scytonematopsis contorta HA4267-MV1]|jgi:membrane protease YdiL (CAAX protease family)|nr:CPBP family intramembrane metalloprotease [Scytonematopsis contorta HA4267-MV1]
MRYKQGFITISPVKTIFGSLFFVLNFYIFGYLTSLALSILFNFLSLDLIYYTNNLASDIVGIFSASATTFVLIICIKGYPRINFIDYLGIKKLNFKQTRNWSILLVLYIFIELLFLYLTKPPLQLEIMKGYKEHLFIPVLYAYGVIFAPIYEELLYRGFMIPGIANSRFGTVGALLISSFLFAITHFHYNLYYQLLTFCSGIFFGIARIQTGSTILAIYLHALNNLFAITYLLIYVHHDFKI